MAKSFFQNHEKFITLLEYRTSRALYFKKKFNGSSSQSTCANLWILSELGRVSIMSFAFALGRIPGKLRPKALYAINLILGHTNARDALLFALIKARIKINPCYIRTFQVAS